LIASAYWWLVPPAHDSTNEITARLINLILLLFHHHHASHWQAAVLCVPVGTPLAWLKVQSPTIAHLHRRGAGAFPLQFTVRRTGGRL